MRLYLPLTVWGTLISTLLLAMAQSPPASGPIAPQPPLPYRRATNDLKRFKLSPDFRITDVPTTREYNWEISAVTGSPDGYERRIFAINGQYPGPTIEANEGDTVVIHVTNQLDRGQSIHWHGMLQNGSQWMDGVPGISQCVIPPNGGRFTYKFTINNQFGTYWWHSHYANDLADGLIGGLLVHSVRDPIKRGRDFDEEQILFVSDWMDVSADTVVDALHAGGFEGSPAPPDGDAILINGVGLANCTKSTARWESRCTKPNRPEIRVPVNKRIRFRIINPSAHLAFRVSIDNHPFELVEVDDTPVYGPTDMHEVLVAPGQRASIIVNTNQGHASDAFWIRAAAAIGCTGAVEATGLGVLRYDTFLPIPLPLTPRTKPWNDLAGKTPICQDMDEMYKLVPRISEPIPPTTLQVHTLNSAFGSFRDHTGTKFFGFGFNNVTYMNQINYPLLSQLEDGLSLNGSLVPHIIYDGIGGGDIILNNLDFGPSLTRGGIPHPYHLHGRAFWIVGRGEGRMDPAKWATMQPNLDNPLRRDTVLVDGGTWIVLRMMTDVPGVWPIHCHIGWHLSEGKLAAVVIQPETIKQFNKPPEWDNLCNGLNPGDFGPD